MESLPRGIGESSGDDGPSSDRDDVSQNTEVPPDRLGLIIFLTSLMLINSSAPTPNFPSAGAMIWFNFFRFLLEHSMDTGLFNVESSTTNSFLVSLYRRSEYTSPLLSLFRYCLEATSRISVGITAAVGSCSDSCIVILDEDDTRECFRFFVGCVVTGDGASDPFGSLNGWNDCDTGCGEDAAY